MSPGWPLRCHAQWLKVESALYISHLHSLSCPTLGGESPAGRNDATMELGC